MNDKPHYICISEGCDRVKSSAGQYCHTCETSLRKMARDLAKPPKVYKQIKRVSDKRKVENAEYLVKRDEYLKAHPGCEIKLEGCTRVSVEIHHSGKRNGEDLNNVEFFLASCRHCHNIIETKMSAKQRRDLGFLKTIPKDTI